MFVARFHRLANSDHKTSQRDRGQTGRRRGSRYRPQVELLEDRWMPSAVRPGFSANSLPASDEGWAGPVSLGFTVNFFGVAYNQLYVNSNGNVTFGQALSADPFDLTRTSTPIIAP